MANDLNDWRIVEVLKLIRQCIVCPYCGALAATDAGVESHKKWHMTINNKVQDIDNKFAIIHEYVRGTGGMEDQIRDAITDLRSDAITAITGLSSRVSAIETEIIKPGSGVRARLVVIEANLGIVVPPT